MKKIFFCCFFCLIFSTISFTQAPNQFNYQAIVRNASGTPLLNTPVTVRLSIHNATPVGNVQYRETRNIITSNTGLIAISIGSAGASDIIGGIHTTTWQTGDKFLQVEIDIAGGNNFTDMGTTQLLSVPYALSSADNQWSMNGNNINNKNNGSVGIGNPSPDASALLDLKSDSKGLLIPRLTTVQRTTLASPAKGLLVYQTETPEGFYYNAGTGAAPNWITLGATGPQGVQGPVGATGIVKAYTTAGNAAVHPSTTLNFLSPTLTITIAQGQKVFLVASRALGGYVAVNDLGIFPAYQSTEPGSPIVNLNLGLFGLQTPANTRITFSVNGVFENLPAGTYKFGMSGLSTNPNWTNSEWGYVSALVF